MTNQTTLNTMKLIAAQAVNTLASDLNDPKIIVLANDADPRALDLAAVERIELNFPKFSDGRAFSQAFLLSRRLHFSGDIRATGDVTADQLAQMQRSGFTSAVLRADQDMALAERVLAAYPGFGVGAYQGDAVQASPHFAATQ
jgi:uncharacterized protein (DUF934 family)